MNCAYILHHLPKTSSCCTQILIATFGPFICSIFGIGGSWMMLCYKITLAASKYFFENLHHSNVYFIVFIVTPYPSSFCLGVMLIVSPSPSICHQCNHQLFCQKTLVLKSQGLPDFVEALKCGYFFASKGSKLKNDDMPVSGFAIIT